MTETEAKSATEKPKQPAGTAYKVVAPAGLIDLFLPQPEAYARQAEGVWMAYYSDGSAARPFPTEVEALRYAVAYSCQVEFTRWGRDVGRPEKPTEKSAPTAAAEATR